MHDAIFTGWNCFSATEMTDLKKIESALIRLMETTSSTVKLGFMDPHFPIQVRPKGSMINKRVYEQCC